MKLILVSQSLHICSSRSVPNGTKLFTFCFRWVGRYSNGWEKCFFFFKLETSILFLPKPHRWRPALFS